MWQQIKSLSLVTLIAVLIWVWAEAESLKTGSATTRIIFQPAPNTAVRVDEPSATQGGTGDSIQVRVRLEGSTLAIDEAQRILIGQVNLPVGVDSVPGSPGGTVSLADALRAQRDLRSTGATIVSVEPATVNVTVAKLVARDLPVVADLAGIDAEGDATISPPNVRVTMPEDLAATLGDAATASAVIAREDLTQLRDEGPQTVQARIRLPAALLQGRGTEFVSPARETVRVTLRLRRSSDTYEPPTVPVWISLPPTEGRSWDVEVVEPFLRGVRVTGPADQVRRLRQRELVVIAFVALSSDELASQIGFKPAVLAAVPADILGSGAGNGPDHPARPPSGAADSAATEPAAPFRFSVPPESRAVELRIRRRGSADGAGAGPPR